MAQNPAIPYQVGKTVLFSTGAGYQVAVVTFIGKGFLMVTYTHKGKSITIQIPNGAVQTQV